MENQRNKILEEKASALREVTQVKEQNMSLCENLTKLEQMVRELNQLPKPTQKNIPLRKSKVSNLNQQNKENHNDQKTTKLTNKKPLQTLQEQNNKLQIELSEMNQKMKISTEHIKGIQYL